MFYRKVLAFSALLVSVAAADASAAGSVRLVEAVKHGDRAAIRSLLERGAKVSEAGPDGTTALHWAAHNGDLETLKALLRAGARVNVQNRYGVAPLWLAASNGHTDVVKALLPAGADLKMTRGESGETVLMAAARAGHVEVVQQLLTAGADPNAVDAIRQQTALMWAAAEKHKAVSNVLIDARAKLEAQSEGGLTPLMFAIRAGDIEGTLALLDRGANLKATAPDGTTTLGLAIINAHWELAATMLDRGADANGLDARGRPLHVVAFMRRAENRSLAAWIPRRPTGKISALDLAKALVAHGAKLNERIESPTFAPTHMAVAPVQLLSYGGATPLYIAAKFGDVEMLKFLIASGADPKIATIQGVTPLLAAAGIGHTTGESPETKEEALEAVTLLAAAGNDVNAVLDLRGDDGSTLSSGWNGAGALHGSVLRGAPELAKWLIAQGVQIDRKTAVGATALDMARGTTLGINLHVQPEVAAVIESAMRERGMPIPEFKFKEGNQLQQ